MNLGFRRSEKIIVHFGCFGSFMLFPAKSEVRFVKLMTIKLGNFDSQLILTTFSIFSKNHIFTPSSLTRSQNVWAMRTCLESKQKLALGMTSKVKNNISAVHFDKSYVFHHTAMPHATWQSHMAKPGYC